jgi:simple sugar transport system ATP-binding protein
MRLEALHLTKNFGAFAAVSDVSLEFQPGQIHAVLGENGAGKSTLMKMLFGLQTPTAGEIRLDGKTVAWRSSQDAIAHGLGMVQQHFTLVGNLSAIDNIMLGAETCDGIGRLNRDAAIKHLESVLPSQHLSVPWRALINDLSVGQRQRVEILKLLFRDAKVLFLDEPTAVLTPSEIDEFFEVLRRLRAQGRTIVLITHKINEVIQVCDTYAVLRAGRLQSRGQVAGQSVDAIVESMIGRRIPEFKFERRQPGADYVVVAEHVAGGGVMKNISLHVHAGEVVGIAGVEGSGQSQFVDALMGLIPHEGRLEVLGKTVASTREVRERGTALVPEDRLEQGLWLEETCHANMIIGLEERFSRRGLLQAREIERVTGDWARAFDVRAASLKVTAGSLSGGNQQKLIFAREVNGRSPRLLIAHQPTRGVDLGAIDLIHRRMMELRNSGRLGLLVLSSELDELLKLCDRLYVFFNGAVTAHFERSEFDRRAIGAAMTGVAHAR